MTKEQYEKYQQIESEIKPIRAFLLWCGDKYRDKTSGRYPFSIKTLCKRFAVKAERRWSTESDNEFKIPEELQRRIIKVTEEYLEEREKEQAAL